MPGPETRWNLAAIRVAGCERMIRLALRTSGAEPLTDPGVGKPRLKVEVHTKVGVAVMVGVGVGLA